MTVSLDSEEYDSAHAATAETPESLLIERSHHELIQKAIDDLPVIYREAILLCDVEEMSYQEIAETTSVPIGTVMSRLARARNSLRSALTKKLQGV